MKLLLSSLLFTSILLFFSYSTEEAENPDHSNIQIALLLDTSGSMDGLIDQTKSQLWNILNTLSDAKRKGENATIQISLYHYGNDGIYGSRAHVQQLSPFTENADDISELLFALKTNGGDEYCGEVIHSSLTDLKWNKNTDLRMIYIAGNESFAQGNRKYKGVISACQEKGIIVNTIFCGDKMDGINLEWKKAADLGNGDYNFINQDKETQYVSTPYDQEIADINVKLNNTYIAIDKNGRAQKSKMETQDKNAEFYGLANSVSRSVYKSKKNYNNSSWDLVDAYEKDKNKVLNNKNLPGVFKNLDRVSLEKEIVKLQSDRTQIKLRISELSKQRTAYIQNNSTTNDNGLESIIKKSVQRRLIASGFTFDDMADSPQIKGITYPETETIDYNSFIKLTTDLKDYREQRRISIIDFYNYANEPNTIILDTRSAQAFNESHLEGAIHLNFSDFTAEKLAKVIPSKETRILIYCNNNFNSELTSMVGKGAPLALNIPTFINLYGYGYENIYELKSLLTDSFPKLEVTNVKGYSK